MILILLCFRIKNLSEGIFNSDMCYRYDSWCRTIQGVIVPVMSNRYRTSCFTNFEITRAIIPWIVLHSVGLVLLTLFILLITQYIQNKITSATYNTNADILHTVWPWLTMGAQASSTFSEIIGGIFKHVSLLYSIYKIEWKFKPPFFWTKPPIF